MRERVWTQNGSTPKYDYNVNAFSVINSEDKAYWLGFLYADGWVSKKGDKFHLSLGKKDSEHLCKYRDFIAPNKPLEIQEKQNAVRLAVCSKSITSDLISKGCVPKKSLILKPPTEGMVPKEFIRHFIRGYFDGDGCSRIVKGTRVSISITGTYDILEFIVNAYREQGAVCRAKINKPNYNAYVWANESVKDLKIIYDFMYDGAFTFLERKEAILRRVFECV